jgi:hypothetical protein
LRSQRGYREDVVGVVRAFSFSFVKSSLKLSSVTSRGMSAEPLRESSALNDADTMYTTGKSAKATARIPTTWRHQVSRHFGRFLRFAATAGAARRARSSTTLTERSPARSARPR